MDVASCSPTPGAGFSPELLRRYGHFGAAEQAAAPVLQCTSGERRRVALTATIYVFSIDLSDLDRGVFETLELRVARHPSETAEYMLVRVLAYCAEFCEGIELTEGVSSGDEPALLVRDLTGRVTAWIEVGLPDASRLHRGSKLAGRVAVYTHRDVRQLLGQLTGATIHRASGIPIRAFERGPIEALAGQLERRTSLAMSIAGQELFVSLGERTFTLPYAEHRL